MKQQWKKPDVTQELINQVQNLRRMTERLSQLIGKYTENREDAEGQDSAYSGASARIIPFPVPEFSPAAPDEIERRLIAEWPSPNCFLALPGDPLCDTVPDYRPFLQRDGLILLSWDMRLTEKGERFTAYWVTSAGISRFYASKPVETSEFPFARPHRKSYAAEDGIEFYGQESPDYLVQVAPELMRSNPRHAALRQAHVQLLKRHGSQADFDYRYLLKTEKNPRSAR